MNDLVFREGGFGADAVDYLAAWDSRNASSTSRW